MRHLSGIDRRDVALAALVLLAGQVDVLAPGLFSTNLVGPRWAVSVVYLICAGAVLLRRGLPGTAFAIMAGTLALQAVTVGTTEGNGAMFPALILSYSVAVYGTRRVAIAALCTIPVLATVREVCNPDNTSVADVFNGLAWDLAVIAA
jgi:hypothetical protein